MILTRTMLQALFLLSLFLGSIAAPIVPNFFSDAAIAKPTARNAKRSDQARLAFEYVGIRPSGVNILRWKGSPSPQLADVINVSSNKEILGQLIVIRRSRTKLSCRYLGKKLDLKKLGQYELTFIGKPLNQSFEPSVFSNEISNPIEFLPQISFSGGASFKHNDLLDVATLSPLGQSQDSATVSALLSAPALDRMKWLNYFYISGVMRFHSKSRSRIVIGAEEQTAFLLEDEISSMRYSLGIRVPLPYQMLSSLSVYGAMEHEDHKIRLESSLLQETDEINAKLDSTLIGASYTFRIVENLFISLEYEQSLESNLQITANQSLLTNRKGSIEQRTFGLRPYIYYELWELYPIVDLKFDTFIGQSQSTYTVKEINGSESTETAFDGLVVELSIRMGLIF